MSFLYYNYKKLSYVGFIENNAAGKLVIEKIEFDSYGEMVSANLLKLRHGKALKKNKEAIFLS